MYVIKWTRYQIEHVIKWIMSSVKKEGTIHALDRTVAAVVAGSYGDLGHTYRNTKDGPLASPERENR